MGKNKSIIKHWRQIGFIKILIYINLLVIEFESIDLEKKMLGDSGHRKFIRLMTVKYEGSSTWVKADGKVFGKMRLILHYRGINYKT